MIYLQARRSLVAHVSDGGSLYPLCEQPLWHTTVRSFASKPADLRLCRNCARVMGERDAERRQVEQGTIPKPTERDELTEAAAVLQDAWHSANIDGFGDEGAGYDAEYAAQELRKAGWTWKGDTTE